MASLVIIITRDNGSKVATPVPNQEVTIKNGEFVDTKLTNSDGSATFQNISAQIYEVSTVDAGTTYSTQADCTSGSCIVNIELPRINIELLKHFNYFICARAVKDGVFIPEPGTSLYLKVPEGTVPNPTHSIPVREWINEVLLLSAWGKDRRGGDRGDLLFFVHGYNTSMNDVLASHVTLDKNLHNVGFRGSVVTFIWPSDDKVLNYLEDRHDAKHSAMNLVRDGIKLLSLYQIPDCYINVHLLGHSTGAFVIREAFDDADDNRLKNTGWSVSQIAFIGGDISSSSMSDNNARTVSLYKHCGRLTNYFSKYDGALKLSNAKRIGLAPRVGRVGLPDDAPKKAVDVDCSEYFKNHVNDDRIGHSWYIHNETFIKDLFETLKGDLDRGVIPTRQKVRNNEYILI